ALRRGNTDRALQLAESAVDPESKDFRDQVWHATLLVMARKDDEAGNRFRRAIALADTEPEPYVAFVQFLAARGRGQEGIAVANEAKKKLSPDKAPLALAQCYEALGLLNEARQNYDTAYQQHPGDANTLRAVASFYLKTGRLNEVAPLLRAVVSGRV